MTRPIVVTGATGVVGRHVVDGLLAAGRVVRAMSRRPEAAVLPPGVEVATGDLDQPSTLDTAFDGAAGLVLIAWPETAGEVVARAEAAGIDHVVVISSAAVTAGYDSTWHLPIEQAVQAAGLDWSIVRPGEFAINGLSIWGPSIRHGRFVIEPFPEQAGNPIHERDVADVIVADLLDPPRRGRIDTIVGPGTLTKRQQVAAIATAIGEPIELRHVTPDEARAFYRDQGGFAADNADFLFGFESYDGIPGAVDEPHDASVDPADAYRTLTDITGAPARTYAQWAHDHATGFAA
jgi:uncharacterized protein YbjT (DUF2867 family)